ncbi:hypothetical protein [Floridanema evergladense]|uniref:Uncharacterized protein n=1 Tax=Floridaenema evergladense BLCC-F167 TaxID=3153639 RepID=A0ABV4WJ78_9CYAN
MNSEKPRSANTPREETTDRGLIQPDAGSDSFVKDYNDQIPEGVDPNNNPEDIFDSDDESKLGDRQITIANTSPG